MVSERDQNEVSKTLWALTSHHCRETMRYLMQTEDDVATLREIATHLDSFDDIHDVEQLEELLYHKHLPKLADGDLIYFDTQAKTVQYPGDETAESVLEELGQEP